MAEQSSRIKRPLSVSETVLEQLRNDIIENKFKFGEKISEAQLSELYGVTKAPIRWAYSRLEGEGLIEIKPQTGTFIMQPSLQDISAICELRVALEMEALKLALQRNLTLLQNLLTDVCDKMQVALKNDQSIEYQNLDATLHLSIVQCASSDLLLQTYLTKVQSYISVIRYRLANHPQHQSNSFKDHVNICQLVKHNDFKSAKQALRKHIQFSKNYYQNALHNYRKQHD